MSRDWQDKKVGEICDFAIEASKGNFALQLQTEDSDFLEPGLLFLNIMNEELNVLFHHAHLSPSYPAVIFVSIIISRDLEIEYISKRSLSFLGYTSAPSHLYSIITQESHEQLLKLIDRTASAGNFEKNIELSFKNSKGLIFKTNATIDSLKTTTNTGLFIINATKIIYRNKTMEEYRDKAFAQHQRYPTRNRSILLQENRKIIEKLHDYLLQNIDQEFPGLKELARKMGASESKLKKGFKFYYGTSIYQYFNEKRFEKAHLLLSQTEKQVSTIARECGFVSNSHFSRSFKEHFGYRPSDVQRKTE